MREERELDRKQSVFLICVRASFRMNAERERERERAREKLTDREGVRKRGRNSKT